MRYVSLCSGIEAATVAWEPLGWEPLWFSEVEPFCCALLKHYYPDTPNLGDMTAITEADLERFPRPDVLVGGTPCTSFSVAGLRGGLDDPRGNLALRFIQLAGILRPRWVVWENVPGVFSSTSGTPASPPPQRVGVGHGDRVVDTCEFDETGDLACLFASLAECGYGVAWRVLDAQYCGVPQRRRRVFVVGYLGDWRPAAAVLLNRESLRRHPPPSREAGSGATHGVSPCVGASGRGFSRAGETRGQDPVVAGTLESRGATGGYDPGAHGAASGHLVPAASDARTGDQKARDILVPPPDDSEWWHQTCNCGHRFDGPLSMACPSCKGDSPGYGGWTHGDPFPAPIAFDTTQVTSPGNYSNPQPGDACHPLASEQHPPAVAYQCHGSNVGPTGTMRAGNGNETGGVPFVVSGRERGDDGRGYSRGPHVSGLPQVDATKPDMVVAYRTTGNDGVYEQGDKAAALNCGTDPTQQVLRAGMAVRRLLPVETERLQGFPDDYTLIEYRGKPAKDGPRYRAIGNGMAVPCMRWLGERIMAAEQSASESEP